MASIANQIANEPYMPQSLEESRFDFTFSGKKTWWGGGWGIHEGNLKEYAAVMVNDEDKLYVRKLSVDWDDGIGQIKLDDSSMHSREMAMPVPLLAGEQYWRGNSTHGNQVKHAIRCFGEKLTLEHCALGENGGSVFQPGHAQLPKEPSSSQNTRREFIVDYIARVDGAYFAVCKSLEGPTVFVRIGVKDAADVFYKTDAEASEGRSVKSGGEAEAKRRKVDMAAAPIKLESVDLNLFIDILDRKLLPTGASGLSRVCMLFKQAEVFRSKREYIEGLKKEQSTLLSQIQADSLNNAFDTSKMERGLEIQKELHELMHEVEAAAAIESPGPSASTVEPSGVRFFPDAIESELTVVQS